MRRDQPNKLPLMCSKVVWSVAHKDKGRVQKAQPTIDKFIVERFRFVVICFEIPRMVT